MAGRRRTTERTEVDGTVTVEVEDDGSEDGMATAVQDNLVPPPAKEASSAPQRAAPAEPERIYADSLNTPVPAAGGGWLLPKSVGDVKASHLNALPRSGDAICLVEGCGSPLFYRHEIVRLSQGRQDGHHRSYLFTCCKCGTPLGLEDAFRDA